VIEPGSAAPAARDLAVALLERRPERGR
jgi:hypothetical protein